MDRNSAERTAHGTTLLELDAAFGAELHAADDPRSGENMAAESRYHAQPCAKFTDMTGKARVSEADGGKPRYDRLQLSTVAARVRANDGLPLAGL